MAKLVIKRQADRQPTEEDIRQAAEACCNGGTTARSLAGRTGMTLRTAMRALCAVQTANRRVRTEYVPLKDSHSVQQLLYVST